MKDKIDLDAIIVSVWPGLVTGPNENPNIKKAMKEAIHQALVLASEHANTETIGISDGYECWDVTSVDKQSILNVEKLIV